MKTALFCVLICLVVQARAAEPVFRFDDSQAGRTSIVVGEMKVAEFVWDDPKITRPYFCDIRTLSGVQVSRNHPPIEGQDVADHPEFHPGLWLAFGDISGNDYWRLKAKVKCRPESVKSSSQDKLGVLEATFDYLAQDHPEKNICTERLRCHFQVADQGYRIAWESTFSGSDSFSFGDQEEMGLGIRVATSMRAEQRQRGDIPPGNGRIRDAEGRQNGEQVWGNASRWCDYRGEVDGKMVGITLLCHPDNFRPSWFHARDYGLLVANAFGRRAFHRGEPSSIVVSPGDTFLLRYGVFVYDLEDSKNVDLEAAFKTYLSNNQVKGDLQ